VRLAINNAAAMARELRGDNDVFINIEHAAHALMSPSSIRTVETTVRPVSTYSESHLEKSSLGTPAEAAVPSYLTDQQHSLDAYADPTQYGNQYAYGLTDQEAVSALQTLGALSDAHARPTSPATHDVYSEVVINAEHAEHADHAGNAMRYDAYDQHPGERRGIHDADTDDDFDD
jgi:hypothetical protein